MPECNYLPHNVLMNHRVLEELQNLNIQSRISPLHAKLTNKAIMALHFYQVKLISGRWVHWNHVENYVGWGGNPLFEKKKEREKNYWCSKTALTRSSNPQSPRALRVCVCAWEDNGIFNHDFRACRVKSYCKKNLAFQSCEDEAD